MYYTRPNLRPLNLDLVEASGGGMMPAQFTGTTPDNRPVYMRYRGGWLSVECGEVGASQNAPMRTLLKVQIGPPYDGDIELEQICDLASITIRGKRPEVAQGRHNRDWSGKTTYWERHVKVTEKGSSLFLENLRVQLGEVRIFERHWIFAQGEQPRLSSLEQKANLRDCPDNVSLAVKQDTGLLSNFLANPDQTSLDLLQTFGKLVSFQFSWHQPRANYQFPSYFMEQRPEINFFAASLSGAIRTQFETNNAHDKALVEQVVSAADSSFSNSLTMTQLATGTATRSDVDWIWYSNDMIETCRTDLNFVLDYGINEGAPQLDKDRGAEHYYVLRPTFF